MKECKRVYTAHVDNSEEKCKDYLLTDCIISDESYAYLGIKKGDSLKEILEKIENAFKEQSKKIVKLNNRPKK